MTILKNHFWPWSLIKTFKSLKIVAAYITVPQNSETLSCWNRLRTTLTGKVVCHTGANLISLFLWPTVGSGAKINLKPAQCRWLEEDRIPSTPFQLRDLVQGSSAETLITPTQAPGGGQRRKPPDCVEDGQPRASWRGELTQGSDLENWTKCCNPKGLSPMGRVAPPRSPDKSKGNWASLPAAPS